jgi:hypothetical protein
MRDAQKGRTHSEESKKKISEAKIRAAKGTPVIVSDHMTNKKKEYISIGQAAKALNTYPMTLSRCMNNKRNYLGRFQIEKK